MSKKQNAAESPAHSTAARPAAPGETHDKGDLNGTDQRVVQAAVDTVARMGGGVE